MAKGTLNEVKIIGYLGRDPELKSLNGGGQVCSINLSTDEGYKDKSTGAAVERSEWHRVEAFGKLAGIMAEYLKKGARIYICGALRTDEYEKDGVKRYSTKIVASEMIMLDRKQTGIENSNQPQAPAQQLGYQFEDGAAIQPSDVKRYKAANIGPWPVGQKPPYIPAGY